MAVFREIGGLNIIFLFSKPPKGTSLRGTASFDVFCVKISFEASAVTSLKNQKNEIIAEPDELYFTHMGRKNPWSDLHKILHWGDIRDVITDANLGDNLLSHFSVARGHILGFSIGFRSRPYNTLVLPCECVT